MKLITYLLTLRYQLKMLDTKLKKRTEMLSFGGVMDILINNYEVIYGGTVVTVVYPYLYYIF